LRQLASGRDVKGMGMKVKKTGDLKFIQEWNRFLILNVIRREGPISRSEIAKLIDISPTTVTTAVSEMIREGLVAEVGSGTSRGGRKPILLKFVPDSKFLIAVSIKNSSISVSRMNLDAEIKRKESYPTGGRKGDDFIRFVISCIDGFLSGEQNFDRCLGISISCPGIVDPQKGSVRYNSKLDWQDVPLVRIIEDRFCMKTWLDNDANAMALAEKNFGAYKNSDHLVHVTVGDGVGAGIVANGELFCGHGGGAGEFGHICIVPDGAACECGNTGCLENYVAWPAVRSRIVGKLANGRPSLLRESGSGDGSQIEIEDFLIALEQEDVIATEVALEISAYLAKGLVSLINLFNPQVVILGGDLFSGNSILLEQVTRLTRQSIMNVFSEEIIIVGSSFGRDQHLVGAASVLLNDQFRFSLLA